MPPHCILSPLEGMATYLNDIRLVHPSDGRVVVNPALFATVFFEGGAQPEVRQALLACFDAFEDRFAEHLRGGRIAGSSKYSGKTAKGVEAMRQRIVQAKPHEHVELLRSDVTDQNTAPDYAFECLTNQQHPTLGDGGKQSYLKFVLPWSLAQSAKGLAVYEDYLQLVCHTLPVRGGYGGLTAALPFSYHRYMPQEWTLAQRFSGLEMDCTPHFEAETYRILSQEGPRESGPVFGYLKSGANVLRIGHIKGVNWYTILGDVFVQRLGGESALRQQLNRADIGVQRQGQCVLIRAGEFPRLGAPEEGLIEPYAFVNRVVRCLRDPEHDGLHSYMEGVDRADAPNTRRWLARFDLPQDGPVVPWTPAQNANTAFPTPTTPQASGLSARAGDICPESGEWYAIHLGGEKRYIQAGEVMPGPTASTTGAVIWYLQKRT